MDGSGAWRWNNQVEKKAENSNLVTCFLPGAVEGAEAPCRYRGSPVSLEEGRDSRCFPTGSFGGESGRFEDHSIGMDRCLLLLLKAAGWAAGTTMSGSHSQGSGGSQLQSQLK